MENSHHIETITSNSPYLGFVDPAARKKFVVGEMILVCEETGGAIAISNIATYENCCPFCNDNIYEITKERYSNKTSIPSKEKYVPTGSSYQVDTGYGVWETIVFSFIIGGGGSLLFSFTLLTENIFYYITQILLISIVMLLTHKITKQPWGVALAVALANLIPLFFNNNRISLGYLGFFVITVLLSWIISVNLKTLL